MKNCHARVYGQEYHCYVCGYVWGINDKNPPECKNAAPVEKKPVPVEDERPVRDPDRNQRAIEQIRKLLE